MPEGQNIHNRKANVALPEEKTTYQIAGQDAQ